MKTYQPKAKEIVRNWHLVDAKEKILGRLSSEISKYLMGKNKVTYVPHLDMGDYVVLLNSEKVKVSGKKEKQKKYFRHSGYPGGFKEVSYMKLKVEQPQKIIELAVKRMLPANRLRDKRMSRLKIILGDKNPYEDKFQASSTKS
ncbi:50S ribosomal protein L13 [Candidatus Woesebacteria bacterium RBG_16_39_8b]|jgi:large subunit ribosomal protein L13|uniref:Large ribosomal subunit protein uL13 n=1 Tax=Candidatus Woesebacteria bacterium RBG_16_39_8b TaxID=1802482 RepID=A0A1F7XE47_9BACT|nr:MAG: 50S ribosomal protein L13 [Candidatus Woesebacteria bacterium RBG_16_39_8b]